MGLKIEFKPGQTPLSEEDKEGLIIKTITTQGELDEFEQHNISKAIQWTMGKKIAYDKLFSEDYLVQLHKKMYGEIWKWAGKFRTKETNIGVASHMIRVSLKQLIDDAKYWHEKETFMHTELALRFKHRIVSIHCFPNGNGRHSRLVADLILEKLYDQNYFNWGGSSLVKNDELRKKYIASLKSADKGSLEALIAFAQS